MPRHHSHHHHRDDREPRYVETEKTYERGGLVPYAPDVPYSRQTDLIRRPARQDSDLSVEEVRQEFPPPVGGYVSRSLRPDDRYSPSSVRSRSADRHSRHRDDDRISRTSEVYEEKKVESRRRSLSRNQKILAAVGGAALAVGGKELWDHRQASTHDRPVSRNALATAAVGAAGAFAAYKGAEFISKRRTKTENVKTYTAYRGRDGEVEEHYTSEEEEKPKSRRKSIVEGALGLAGLGGAAAAAKGSGDKNKKDGEHNGAAKFQQAAKAALLAGATEAFRVRKEPRGWGSAKGKHILTAAISAGGIDAAADRNPDVHSKRHILEAVVGGLAGNRLINSSRHEVEKQDERSRSRARSSARSQSRGGDGGGGLSSGAGLAALATAGIGALAGKKFLDDKREKSREGTPSRSRRGRSDSYDSRSPSLKDKRSRSKSVTDYARKGLAAFGIGEAAHEAGKSRDRSRDCEVVEEETVVRRRRHGSDDDHRRRRHRGSDDDDDYDDRHSRRHRDDVYEDPGYADSCCSVDSTGDGGRRDKDRRKGNDKGIESDSSLGSSSGDERRIKKMKGKQLLTMGLASVATISAARSVYQSIEKREARKKVVREGKMSPEEAKKLKSKAVLQDAASMGIAALGIQGAISEIKEANKIRRECKEFREKKELRHQRRLERLQKAGGGGGSLRDDYEEESPDRGRIGYGSRQDGSQYGGQYGRHALMAAPVGYSDGR